MGADYRQSMRSMVYAHCFDRCPANATRYFGITGGVENADIFSRYLIAATGVLRYLTIHVDLAPGVGETIAFTVMIDGIASTLTATLADANVQVIDAVNAEAVVAGQTISIRAVASLNAIPPRVSVTAEHRPT